MPDEPLHPDPAGDPLDALLASARWPEPTPGAERRVLDGWRAGTHARGRRRLLIQRIAALASVAACVAVVLCLPRGHRRTGRLAFVDPAPLVTSPATARPDEPPTMLSRPATPYERLAMEAPQSSPPRPPVGTAAAPVRKPTLGGLSEPERLSRLAAVPADRRALLRELVERLGDGPATSFLQLVLDPRSRPDALAALHGAPSPARAADALIAHLDDPNANFRLAAARALGELCEAPTRDRLKNMTLTNNHRREALAALLCCPNDEATRFLADARVNRSIDAQLRAIQPQVDALR